MGQVEKVKREVLKACMTCPLCNTLLKEATTISLCLHTFCRKCIYEKLSDEEVDSCPVCNVDLGCLPVEKLRPDHNLQDIRAKIFPFKRRKVEAPEVTPSIALPAKRKERSLSSLVVDSPKVPIQTGMTGRRSRASARKAAAALRSGFGVDESSKKEDSSEEHPMSRSSPGSPNKVAHNKKQGSSLDEPSREHGPNESNDVKIGEGKADLWTPLNFLVEAANKSKSSRPHSQGPLAKSEPPGASDYEVHSPDTKQKSEPPNNGYDNGVYRTKIRNKEDNTTHVKMQDDNNGSNTLPMPIKRRRLSAARKRAAMSQELSLSAQGMLDSSGGKNNRRNCPIWFSLVASEDQKGDASLPQISTCYLRIKDGNMPVSFIHKYLVKKLDLSSEAEVEIMCRGQRVLPTLQLHNVVDLWFRTASSVKKVPALVGSSAKDFVMVLSYSRKVNQS